MKKDTKGLHDELNEQFPLLQQLKQHGTGETLPPGYFDALGDSVMQKIRAEEKDTPQPLNYQRGGRVFGLPRYMAYSIAATFVLVLAAVWVFQRDTAQIHEGDYGRIAAALTPTEAEEYILENITEFELSTLESYVSTDPDAVPAPPSESSPAPKNPNPETAPADNLLDDLSDEELDILLDDLSDEELEALL